MDKHGSISLVNIRSSSLHHVEITISCRGTFWIWVIANIHLSSAESIWCGLGVQLDVLE